MKIILKTCTKCDDYKQMIVNEKIIFEGDYYHEKVDYKKEGFVEGLRFCGYKVEVIEEDFVCNYCM